MLVGPRTSGAAAAGEIGAKAAEETKRTHMAAQRLAKAQAAPKPLTPASQPTAPKAKAKRSARRTHAAELEHRVHITPGAEDDPRDCLRLTPGGDEGGG